jgi:hypothetical protein
MEQIQSLLKVWGPLVILICVWLFILWRMGMSGPVRRQQLFMERHMQHMDRIEALLERAVTCLEKGNVAGLTRGGTS